MNHDPMNVDIPTIIARSLWFSDLPADAQQELCLAATLRHMPNNSMLWRPGDKITDVFCVLIGQVRLNITSALGQEFTILDMENEYWFGDVALIDADTRFSNAQIIGDATLLVIPRTSVQSVGERWPALYKGFFVESSNRISQLFDLMGGMLFYPLRVRLAGRILELIRIHGEQKPEGTYLNVNLSQNDFARLSLGSRQRINKIFREWNEQGIIQMRNDQYFIENMEALEKEIDVQHL